MSFPGPEPAPPRRSTTVIVVAVGLVLLLALTGAGLAAWAAAGLFDGSDDGDGGTSATLPKPSATVAEPAYPPALARYYEQDLDWKTCGDNQCARLTVPLDYAEPDGKTIELQVLRVLAARRDQRVGQLLVNPGGPGASGVDYASAGSLAFGAKLARYFDLIGLDPRGVGQSTPLTCGDTEETDEFVGADPDPDTPEEVQEYDEINRDYGQGCLDESGDLARHMSTVEAAKDMDVLRSALGERQLDYYGASYGTLLGATYADLFPGNVRRMVLDGAVDPTLTNEALSVGQSGGFETALTAYLESCTSNGECAVLGSDVASAKQRLLQFFKDLDSQPLETGSDRQLTEALARYGIIYPLYLKELWSVLSISLTAALEKGDGSRLLALADQYSSRGPDGYRDNSTAAFNAVTCLDYSDSVPVDQIPSKIPEFVKASPTFGGVFAYDLSKCASWPVKSTAKPKPLHAAGAPPIVVVGTTRDPATPYEWSESLASQLDSGRLITRDGDGHTGFRKGNRCVDNAVERYLIGGHVPEDDLTC